MGKSIIMELHICSNNTSLCHHSHDKISMFSTINKKMENDYYSL